MASRVDIRTVVLNFPAGSPGGGVGGLGPGGGFTQAGGGVGGGAPAAPQAAAATGTAPQAVPSTNGGPAAASQSAVAGSGGGGMSAGNAANQGGSAAQMQQSQAHAAAMAAAARPPIPGTAAAAAVAATAAANLASNLIAGMAHTGSGGAGNGAVSLSFPSNDPLGRRAYTGNVVKQQCHGYGSLRWYEPDPAAFEGEFRNNEAKQGVLWFGNSGNSRYCGTFKDNYADGKGDAVFMPEDSAALQVYVGSWSGGYPNGSGIGIMFNGDRYEGIWQHGRALGQGKYRWYGGPVCTGQFQNEEPVGPCLWEWANGRRAAFFMTDALPSEFKHYARYASVLICILVLLWALPFLTETPPNDMLRQARLSYVACTADAPATLGLAIAEWFLCPAAWLWPWSERQVRSRAIAVFETAMLNSGRVGGVVLPTNWTNADVPVSPLLSAWPPSAAWIADTSPNHDGAGADAQFSEGLEPPWCAHGISPAPMVPDWGWSQLAAIAALYVRLQLKRQIVFVRIAACILLAISGDVDHMLCVIGWRVYQSLYGSHWVSRQWVTDRKWHNVCYVISIIASLCISWVLLGAAVDIGAELLRISVLDELVPTS